jgi:hemolysin activation/secretion protein
MFLFKKFKSKLTRAWLAALLPLVALATAGAVSAQDASFSIQRFQVDGNTLLPQERVEQLLVQFAGGNKVYGDVQKALEALEGEYRRRGYGTVQVYVPEQELTAGVVKLQVSEGVVGKITIKGNKLFNEDNVRASLPNLKQGVAPNMRQLSENVQLANESPAKQLEVTLGVSEEEGKVDIKIDVKEEDPERVYVTLDNTGTKASGKHRIGVSYQNANMGNRDQVLTLAYTTALDQPAGVKVDIFSIGYRLPLYAIGDSIDVIYGNSGTTTPASVLAPGGTLALNGKGAVFGLRYNHIFPRDGEYTSKLVLGYDYKYMNSRCTTNGVPTSIDPPGVTASCTPYTLRPVTVTYSGQWQRPGEAIDFNIGVTHHLFPMGSRYTGPAGIDRYSFVTTRQTSDRFSAIRMGGSYSTALVGEWLGRAAFTGQFSNNPLPAGEQIGLVGGSSVRGFLERAVSTDRGYVANLEVYSPDYAAALDIKGSLKALAFVDWASGHNLASNSFARANVASAGIGVRYNLNKDISARFDIARVLEGHQPTPGNSAEAAKPGDIRGHFGLAFGF